MTIGCSVAQVPLQALSWRMSGQCRVLVRNKSGWLGMSLPEVGHDQTIALDRHAVGALPLVMCVSPDPAVRERVVRQLDGGGVVMMFPDLDVLRAMLNRS